MIAAVERRRARLLQQSEQPDGDRARRQDRDRLRRARAAQFARHGHPDRRGVSRLRDGSGVPDRDSAGDATPNVFVARTFSKAYGMAGMRIGYAIGQTDTVKPLARAEDAVQRQRLRHRRGDRRAERSEAHRGRARAQHRSARVHGQGVRGAGRKPTDSQGNFIFVDIGRPAREFRDACAKSGVMVGRDFPPFEKTHVPHLDRHDGRDAEGRGRCSADVLTAGTTSAPAWRTSDRRSTC